LIIVDTTKTDPGKTKGACCRIFIST